ncbi:hypothetical protein BESB_023160 [Besnoitia besnoiti]|uniref:Uncharacterized protein n=1 Tax=Besnoitia besnoiti TaxID=94643 RepID=A0A2A9M3N0_BESBE|nr:hypothetical protein BESB_023160 [Besnoitia besnoiti]PFH31824.1 hypothetical protein BESB_023160 [Besnoitia besnoiti]
MQSELFAGVRRGPKPLCSSSNLAGESDVKQLAKHAFLSALQVTSRPSSRSQSAAPTCASGAGSLPPSMRPLQLQRALSATLPEGVRHKAHMPSASRVAAKGGTALRRMSQGPLSSPSVLSCSYPSPVPSPPAPVLSLPPAGSFAPSVFAPIRQHARTVDILPCGAADAREEEPRTRQKSPFSFFPCSLSSAHCVEKHSLSSAPRASCLFGSRSGSPPSRLSERLTSSSAPSSEADNSPDDAGSIPLPSSPFCCSSRATSSNTHSDTGCDDAFCSREKEACRPVCVPGRGEGLGGCAWARQSAGRDGDRAEGNSSDSKWCTREKAIAEVISRIREHRKIGRERRKREDPFFSSASSLKKADQDAAEKPPYAGAHLRSLRVNRAGTYYEDWERRRQEAAMDRLLTRARGKAGQEARQQSNELPETQAANAGSPPSPSHAQPAQVTQEVARGRDLHMGPASPPREKSIADLEAGDRAGETVCAAMSFDFCATFSFQLASPAPPSSALETAAAAEIPSLLELKGGSTPLGLGDSAKLDCVDEAVRGGCGSSTVDEDPSRHSLERSPKKTACCLAKLLESDLCSPLSIKSVHASSSSFCHHPSFFLPVSPASCVTVAASPPSSMLALSSSSLPRADLGCAAGEPGQGHTPAVCRGGSSLSYCVDAVAPVRTVTENARSEKLTLLSVSLPPRPIAPAATPQSPSADAVSPSSSRRDAPLPTLSVSACGLSRKSTAETEVATSRDSGRTSTGLAGGGRGLGSISSDASSSLSSVALFSEQAAEGAAAADASDSLLPVERANELASPRSPLALCASPRAGDLSSSSSPEATGAERNAEPKEETYTVPSVAGRQAGLRRSELPSSPSLLSPGAPSWAAVAQTDAEDESDPPSVSPRSEDSLSCPVCPSPCAPGCVASASLLDSPSALVVLVSPASSPSPTGPVASSSPLSSHVLSPLPLSSRSSSGPLDCSRSLDAAVASARAPISPPGPSGSPPPASSSPVSSECFASSRSADSALPVERRFSVCVALALSLPRCKASSSDSGARLPSLPSSPEVSARLEPEVPSVDLSPLSSVSPAGCPAPPSCQAAQKIREPQQQTRGDCVEQGGVSWLPKAGSGGRDEELDLQPDEEDVPAPEQDQESPFALAPWPVSPGSPSSPCGAPEESPEAVFEQESGFGSFPNDAAESSGSEEAMSAPTVLSHICRSVATPLLGVSGASPVPSPPLPLSPASRTSCRPPSPTWLASPARSFSLCSSPLFSCLPSSFPSAFLRESSENGEERKASSSGSDAASEDRCRCVSEGDDNAQAAGDDETAFLSFFLPEASPLLSQLGAQTLGAVSSLLVFPASAYDVRPERAADAEPRPPSRATAALPAEQPSSIRPFSDACQSALVPEARHSNQERTQDAGDTSKNSLDESEEEREESVGDFSYVVLEEGMEGWLRPGETAEGLDSPAEEIQRREEPCAATVEEGSSETQNEEGHPSEEESKAFASEVGALNGLRNTALAGTEAVARLSPGNRMASTCSDSPRGDYLSCAASASVNLSSSRRETLEEVSAAAAGCPPPVATSACFLRLLRGIKTGKKPRENVEEEDRSGEPTELLGQEEVTELGREGRVEPAAHVEEAAKNEANSEGEEKADGLQTRGGNTSCRISAGGDTGDREEEVCKDEKDHSENERSPARDEDREAPRGPRGGGDMQLPAEAATMPAEKTAEQPTENARDTDKREQHAEQEAEELSGTPQDAASNPLEEKSEIWRNDDLAAHAGDEEALEDRHTGETEDAKLPGSDAEIHPTLEAEPPATCEGLPSATSSPADRHETAAVAADETHSMGEADKEGLSHKEREENSRSGEAMVVRKEEERGDDPNHEEQRLSVARTAELSAAPVSQWASSTPAPGSPCGTEQKIEELERVIFSFQLVGSEESETREVKDSATLEAGSINCKRRKINAQNRSKVRAPRLVLKPRIEGAKNRDEGRGNQDERGVAEQQHAQTQAGNDQGDAGGESEAAANQGVNKRQEEEARGEQDGKLPPQEGERNEQAEQIEEKAEPGNAQPEDERRDSGDEVGGEMTRKESEPEREVQATRAQQHGGNGGGDKETEDTTQTREGPPSSSAQAAESDNSAESGDFIVAQRARTEREKSSAGAVVQRRFLTERKGENGGNVSGGGSETRDGSGRGRGEKELVSSVENKEDGETAEKLSETFSEDQSTRVDDPNEEEGRRREEERKRGREVGEEILETTRVPTDEELAFWLGHREDTGGLGGGDVCAPESGVGDETALDGTPFSLAYPLHPGDCLSQDTASFPISHEAGQQQESLPHPPPLSSFPSVHWSGQRGPRSPSPPSSPLGRPREAAEGCVSASLQRESCGGSDAHAPVSSSSHCDTGRPRTDAEREAKRVENGNSLQGEVGAETGESSALPPSAYGDLIEFVREILEKAISNPELVAEVKELLIRRAGEDVKMEQSEAHATRATEPLKSSAGERGEAREAAEKQLGEGHEKEKNRDVGDGETEDAHADRQAAETEPKEERNLQKDASSDGGDKTPAASGEENETAASQKAEIAAPTTKDGDTNRADKLMQHRRGKTAKPEKGVERDVDAAAKKDSAAEKGKTRQEGGQESKGAEVGDAKNAPKTGAEKPDRNEKGRTDCKPRRRVNMQRLEELHRQVFERQRRNRERAEELARDQALKLEKEKALLKRRPAPPRPKAALEKPSSEGLCCRSLSQNHDDQSVASRGSPWGESAEAARKATQRRLPFLSSVQSLASALLNEGGGSRESLKRGKGAEDSGLPSAHAASKPTFTTRRKESPHKEAGNGGKMLPALPACPEFTLLDRRQGNRRTENEIQDAAGSSVARGAPSTQGRSTWDELEDLLNSVEARSAAVGSLEGGVFPDASPSPHPPSAQPLQSFVSPSASPSPLSIAVSSDSGISAYRGGDEPRAVRILRRLEERAFATAVDVLRGLRSSASASSAALFPPLDGVDSTRDCLRVEGTTWEELDLRVSALKPAKTCPSASFLSPQSAQRETKETGYAGRAGKCLVKPSAEATGLREARVAQRAPVAGKGSEEATGSSLVAVFLPPPSTSPAFPRSSSNAAPGNRRSTSRAGARLSELASDAKLRKLERSSGGRSEYNPHGDKNEGAQGERLRQRVMPRTCQVNTLAVRRPEKATRDPSQHRGAPPASLASCPSSSLPAWKPAGVANVKPAPQAHPAKVRPSSSSPSSPARVSVPRRPLSPATVGRAAGARSVSSPLRSRCFSSPLRLSFLAHTGCGVERECERRRKLSKKSEASAAPRDAASAAASASSCALSSSASAKTPREPGVDFCFRPDLRSCLGPQTRRQASLATAQTAKCRASSLNGSSCWASASSAGLTASPAPARAAPRLGAAPSAGGRREPEGERELERGARRSSTTERTRLFSKQGEEWSHACASATAAFADEMQHFHAAERLRQSFSSDAFPPQATHETRSAKLAPLAGLSLQESTAAVSQLHRSPYEVNRRGASAAAERGAPLRHCSSLKQQPRGRSRFSPDTVLHQPPTNASSTRQSSSLYSRRRCASGLSGSEDQARRDKKSRHALRDEAFVCPSPPSRALSPLSFLASSFVSNPPGEAAAIRDSRLQRHVHAREERSQCDDARPFLPELEAEERRELQQAHSFEDEVEHLERKEMNSNRGIRASEQREIENISSAYRRGRSRRAGHLRGEALCTPRASDDDSLPLSPFSFTRIESVMSRIAEMEELTGLRPCGVRSGGHIESERRAADARRA